MKIFLNPHIKNIRLKFSININNLKYKVNNLSNYLKFLDNEEN